MIPCMLSSTLEGSLATFYSKLVTLDCKLGNLLVGAPVDCVRQKCVQWLFSLQGRYPLFSLANMLPRLILPNREGADAMQLH